MCFAMMLVKILYPPLVLPHPLSFLGGGGHHLVNTKKFVTNHETFS